MNVVEANGAKIPAIGLGTMTLQGEVCVGAVKTALQIGYRHVDTAEMYGEGGAEVLAPLSLKAQNHQRISQPWQIMRVPRQLDAGL